MQSSNDTTGSENVFYEMQPQPQPRSGSKGVDATKSRQRSVSNASPRGEEYRAGVDFAGAGAGGPSSGGVRRSNTTGKSSLAQSIKRRIGSLRRRKVEGGVYQ